jgi:hypothetical protein
MSSTQRDLSTLFISESFWRLMQTDPIDDKTLLDGAGNLVTELTVSGTVEAYNIKTEGTGSFSGLNTFDGSLILPNGELQTAQPTVGSIITSGSKVFIYL